MTLEEAIKILQDLRYGNENPYSAEAAETLEMALAALEMRIAKKPVRYDIDYPWRQTMTVCKCPHCGRRLRTRLTTANGDAHCPGCGQKIDWRT